MHIPAAKGGPPAYKNAYLYIYVPYPEHRVSAQPSYSPVPQSYM